jgi:hypothetical protein
MTRKPTVSIIGDGTLPVDSAKAKLAEDLGRALVDAGYRIVCGGKGGIMEAAGRGARSSAAYEAGDMVGILPTTDAAVANEFIDVVIPTPLGHMRNALVAQSDAVVAIGGGAGTLCEIAFAWIYDRRIIAFRTDGWSGEMADRKVDRRERFPGEEDRVFGVDSVDEAMALLQGWF